MKKILSYILAYIKLILRKDVKTLFLSRISYDTYFEGKNFVGRSCIITKSHIGFATYLGNGCEISNAKIGRFCSISQNLKIIIGSHPSSIWVSTSPLFFAKSTYFGKGYTERQRFNEFKRTLNGFSVEIGNDVWIGSDVKIMEGITIGDGVIIGTGALVTKDIPPYSVCVGVPARILKKRFNEGEISILLNSKWWEKDENWIKTNALYFNDISNFKQIL